MNCLLATRGQWRVKMTHNKVKSFYFVLCVTIMSLIVAVPGCTRIKVVPPPTQLYAIYRLEVNSNQLGQAYLADPIGADAKYKGNEIWITETVVGTYVADQNSYCTISTL